MLEIGQKAPDFALQNQNGEEVRLSDYKGKKVVLYFYPKDNTKGCTAQSCGFRDFNEEIKSLNAVVIGINKDSVKTHQNFTNKYELPFELLSNQDLDVLQNYGVWQEKKLYGKVNMGIVRTTFIIDENGNIEKIFNKVKASDNPKEVLSYLKGE